MDPRGLIYEAFRIDGVTEADCRSIFFDWALGAPVELNIPTAISALLERHADQPETHPMRKILREGLAGDEERIGRGRRSGRRLGARNADQPR